MIKNSLLAYYDNWKIFDQRLSYASKNIPSLFEVHDGEKFNMDQSMWDEALLDKTTVKLVHNFSKERLTYTRKLVDYLYNVLPKQQSS